VSETGREVLLVLGPSTGGIGVHASSLARGLPGLGWRVRVLTTVDTAVRFELGEDVRTGWPDVGSMSPARLIALRRSERSEALTADLIHAQGHQAGLVALMLTAQLTGDRPPVVVSWHNATIGSGADRRSRELIERWQVRRAQLVSGASGDLVRRAQELGARDALLAPVAAPAAGDWSGDRAAERDRLVDELGLDPGRPIVLTVSRVAAQKNLHVVVDASAELARRVPHQWLVVGDGDAELHGRLQARNEELGCPVHFLGSRQDVPRLMAVADLFVLASVWEARALVVQEAMAAGLPIVATAVGGLPDLLDGVGELVAATDVEALAAGVERMLTDRDLAERRGAAGRRRFAELATEPEVVALWDKTYRDLLAAR
jgi:glycosyltransferase involved in cell wall biosynthesis